LQLLESSTNAVEFCSNTLFNFQPVLAAIKPKGVQFCFDNSFIPYLIQLLEQLVPRVISYLITEPEYWKEDKRDCYF
jgi:hypothetical protein